MKKNQADGFNIHCKCGYSDEWDAFEKSIIGLPLPKGHYQCPSCHTAWTIKAVGEPTKLDNGFIMPATRKAIIIQTAL